MYFVKHINVVWMSGENIKIKLKDTSIEKRRVFDNYIGRKGYS